MPGLDKTGPLGQGSQTGRGLGKCNPKNKDVDNDIQEEFIPRGRGKGRGRGYGKRHGHGWGNRMDKGSE